MVAAFALLALPALSARAADFTFSGTLAPTGVALYSLNVATSPFTLVTLSTTSYASGGFDPVLSLFRGTDGLLLDANDDVNALVPLSVVPADPITGERFDSYFEFDLEPGSYTLALTYSPNYAAGPNLSNGFAPTGPFDSSAGRTGSFTVGIQNVTGAAVVPEPGTVALLAAGALPLAGRLRRRHRA